MASNQTFVRQLYQTVLARDPGTTETTGWSTPLDSGFYTRAQVAYNFLSSAEYQTGVQSLARLYYGAFQRVPDVQGLQFWMNLLRTGATLDQVASQFVNSSEFALRYGKPVDPGSVVDTLYQNIMQRAPDAAGRAYWVDILNHGTGAGVLLNGLAQSAEYQAKANGVVDDVVAYYGIVGRAPTTAELAARPADLTSIVLQAVSRSSSATGSDGITFDSKTLVESPANDGSIITTIAVTLVGDTFKGNIGASLGKIVNVPAGLTGTITKTTDTTATLSFSGTAKANAALNSVSNVVATFSTTDFASGSIAGKSGLTQTLAVNFFDIPASEINGVLALSGTASSAVTIDLFNDKLLFGTVANSLVAGSMSNVKTVDVSDLTVSKATVTFLGDDADNTFTGGTAAATITGGKGNDTLTLGSAANRIKFAVSAGDNGLDVIKNLKIGTGGDVLDFSAFLNKTGTTHIAAVTEGAAAGAAWANGDVLVLAGPGLDTAAAVAASFNAGDFAVAAANGKAVVITSDIVGDAKVWFVVNQAPAGNIDASEVTQVATLVGINNLGLTGYGFVATNFG